ncbi:MAG: transglutaminase domain-containing protein [Myxococcales bacterium]|nr:transglutaminase domain-containing protein [Myxococcales bacterium]
MRPASLLALFAVTTGGLIAGLAVAQSSARKAPVPHEDLPAPSGADTSPVISSGGSGTVPTALRSGDAIIPRPSVDSPLDKSRGEPVLGTKDFGADRQTSVKPDDNTGTDATLHYISVFNPDVLPFKRMSALDAVGDDYTLKIGRPALTEVPVGGVTDPKTRDWFYGNMMIELAPGTDVPLPSVAPDMRILSYDVKPKIALKFEKDGADNFYVRTEESSASGQYRLIIYVDADQGYFAPSLPTTRKYTPAMIAALTPPEIRPMLPDHIRSAGRTTLDKIGIDANMNLHDAFNLLVKYFRGFEAKKLPPTTGDIYRDLCDSQAGVCRHRAFSFMITCNTLGIPARYVQNEAHAFIEVWFPERHWQRIDLGGAALRMDVSNAEDKRIHTPRAEDPFAKPPEYTQQYTQLEGDIRGLSAKQIADRKKPNATPSGSLGGNSGKGNGPAGPDRITPDPTLPTVTQDPKKVTPRLDVTTADTSAFRGDVVHVEGRVVAQGKAIPDHPVDVFLAPAGRHGASPIPLGRAVSDATGRFSQEFTVPGSLNLATYEIYLASPEDAYFNAALSD